MAKKSAPASGRGYHHGDLRRALLDAALSLIEEGEEHDVSLRTVAARAGVYHAAPYRHFQDREALMAAVATIGFDRLLESLQRARETADDGSKLLTMAMAYLAFASKNIGLYRVMFTDNHLAVRFDEGLARSSTAAFQELQDVVGTRSPASGDGDDAKRIATAIWAGLHGTALLAAGRLIPVGGPPVDVGAEAEIMAIVQIMIDRFSDP